jgi:hypothetical protein
LRARSRTVRDFARTREVGIVGELLGEGFGASCPLEGTLTMDVLRTGKLRYDFRFTADDGNAYRFVGEKVLRLFSLRRSMTWLPAKIYDAADAEIATGEVTFDLARDLVSFLRSWRVSKR